MKTVRINIDDIIEQAKEDHRVQHDDERAEKVKESGSPVCDNCDGTGNEFLFMYSKCPKCDGTGIAPISEALN